MTEENAQAAQDTAASESTTLATTQAQDAAGAEAAPTVDAAPAGADDTPTPEEARAMFAERPDAAGCLTTEGWLSRDGTLRS